MQLDEALSVVKIGKEDLIDFRDAKILDDEISYKGHIILSKNELIFIKKKASKAMFRIPVSKIKSLKKIPIMNLVLLSANVSEEGAGFLKKLFGRRDKKISMNDPKSFIEKVKELNKNLK